MKILIIITVLVAGGSALELANLITKEKIEQSALIGKNAAEALKIPGVIKPNGRAQEAPKHSAPFIVSLHLATPGTHFCAGTIIDPLWIITAAVCVDGHDIYATAGLHEWNKRSDGKTIKVIKKIKHYDYKGGVGPDNIALMKLAEPFDFYGQTIAGIGLNSATATVTRNCATYGWARYFAKLQTENVESIYYRNCQPLMPPLYPPVIYTNICAYDDESGGSCHGDYGGPLVCYYGAGNTNPRLTGVLAWQPGCLLNYPSLYTNVASFIDWIYYVLLTNS